MKGIFLTLSFILITHTAAAAGTSSAAIVGSDTPDDSVRVIGTLPYSNQWTYERSSSYLYFNYDQALLSNSNITSNHFQILYPNSNMSIYSLDFFSRLFSLSEPNGNKYLRGFSFWGRYKLGFGLQQGSLTDTDSGTAMPAEKNSLMILQAGLELALCYDWSEWIQPFVGIAYKPYYFRNSSSLSSAESEGTGGLYGPSLGVHLPVLFSHKGSLLAEVHRDIAVSSGQALANQVAGDFGLGFVF